MATCHVCGGSGLYSGSCSSCGGSGYFSDGRGSCTTCGGTGKGRCGQCYGTGQVPDSSSSSSSSSSYTPSSSGGRGNADGDRLLSDYKQAFASFRSNDFDTAIKLCNAVLDNAKGWVGKNDPYYAKFVASTYDLRGCCYAEKAKINKNITYFDQAIADSETAVEWVNNIDWSKTSGWKTNVEAPKNRATLYNNRGNAYQRTGEYEKAIADFKKAADLGDTEAMVSLGFALVNGNGVPKDSAKAVEIWTKAANMGNASAINNLGLCYRDGIGVKQDFAKAEDLLKKAHNAGHTGAQGSLDKLKQMRGY